MTSHDSLDGCQTNAGTLEVSGIMQPLERLEKQVGLLHGEAGAVITDKIDPVPLDRCNPEFYPCINGFLRILPGIAQEVFQEHFDEPRVGIVDKPILDGNPQLP